MTPRWALWVLAGALAALTVLGMASIGIFVAPFTVAAFGAAGRWGGEERVIFGIAAGVGLTLVAIGVLNLDYTPCPSSGTLVLRPGQDEVGCGGTNPVPWFAVGGALMLAGAVGAELRRFLPPGALRPCRRSRSGS